ncbi:effector-associated constant component EACC1 [Streptomyces sp. MMS24-I2-30]|uniref:effector-associated constant component EACC1 n=1 Tax=Streptomyces sp. MMS24-I2-30 TaxID=3351564 RepID=UPI003896A346
MATADGTSGTSSMRLAVTGAADVDQDELDQLTRELRRQLLELDVADVRVARSDGAVPEGAKPGELIAVGALVVSLAPAVLRPALRLLETWMRNRPVRTVKVDVDGRTLELDHASAQQQQQVLDAFVAELRTRSRGDGSPAGSDATAGLPAGAAGPPAVQE